MLLTRIGTRARPQSQHGPRAGAGVFEVRVESWKWMLIGLAMATIFMMWFEGSITSPTGYALIAGTYYAVWAASRELNRKRATQA